MVRREGRDDASAQPKDGLTLVPSRDPDDAEPPSVRGHSTADALSRSRLRGPIGTWPAVGPTVAVLVVANVLMRRWSGPAALVTAVPVSVLLLGVLRRAGGTRADESSVNRVDGVRPSPVAVEEAGRRGLSAGRPYRAGIDGGSYEIP